MKKLLASFISIAAFLLAHTQNQANFLSIGKKQKVFTLSNGRFDESFVNDSIQQIGSVEIDVNTGHIKKLLPTGKIGSAEEDMIVGVRFLSVDPLVSKYPSWSPYLSMGNNPIILIDKDGREPNRSQAATWEQVKAVLTNYFKNSDNQSIHKLRYTEGAGGGGGQVGPFGGESGLRYLFTKKYGWIDLGHFFQVASETQKAVDESIFSKGIVENSAAAYWTARKKLWNKTEEVENGQLEGSETQWSYEDAPSNLAGMNYWFYAYENNSNIIETLEDFFVNDAEVKKPEEAPNYSIMQDKPQKKRWFQQNKSFSGVQNPTASEDNKKVHPDASAKKEIKTKDKTTTQKKKKG